MNLSDVSSSIYLASDDYPVGYVFPALAIEHIKLEEVPVPNSKRVNQKAVIYFVGAKKGWAANGKCLREIGRACGATREIEKAWVGIRVALKVVGDVRRPDGTKGNALRIADIQLPATNLADAGPKPKENHA